MKRGSLALIIGALACAVQTSAEVHRVPTEFLTINAALDASTAGDTVLVAAGVYPDFEIRNVGLGVISACAFLRDGVVLRSEDGPSATFIDRKNISSPESDRMIWARGFNLPGTLVEGFTLTGNPPGAAAVSVQEFGQSGGVAFRDCIFQDLDGSNDSAGAIRALFANSLTVENCTFVNCVSGTAGAINQTEGTLSVSDCLFDQCNTSALRFEGSIDPDAEATIIGCTFSDHVSDDAGAAISGSNSRFVIENCTFENNVVSGGSGGGGGAIALSGIGAKTLTRNLFLNNRVEAPLGVGGAVALTADAITIANNTFYGSSQELLQLPGAVMFISDTNSAALNNNIVANSNGPEAIWVLNGSITTSCNVFWENEGGEAGGFTLDPTDRIVDPEFCSPDQGDLYVTQTSPCLPENSMGCDLIGVFAEGCSTVSVESTSWGDIKARHRNPHTRGGR